MTLSITILRDDGLFLNCGTAVSSLKCSWFLDFRFLSDYGHRHITIKVLTLLNLLASLAGLKFPELHCLVYL